MVALYIGEGQVHIPLYVDKYTWPFPKFCCELYTLTTTVCSMPLELPQRHNMLTSADASSRVVTGTLFFRSWTDVFLKWPKKI